MSAANDDAQLKTISIADLEKILLKEVHSPVLSSFDSDLYRRVAYTLAGLKSFTCEGTEAKVRDRAIALISTSAGALLQTRLHKIIDAGERLDYSKLTDEEKFILDIAGESQKRADSIATAITNGRLEALENAAAKVRSKLMPVRFLKPTGQFVGIDLANYGPFKEQDLATIPYENARSLIAAKAAMQVDSP